MDDQVRSEERIPYKCNYPDKHKHCTGSKLFFGVIVILAGLLLLGFNTGILNNEYKPVIFSWPMFLVVIGILQFFHHRSVVGGLVLVLIGGFFLLPKLDFVDPAFVSLYWPVLIIAAGLFIITKTAFVSKKKSFRMFESGYTGSEIRNGIIEENNIFSGSKRKFQDMIFRGGEINCIFGGSELDLTHAELGEGMNQLEINCIFGGITLIVPSNWNVQLKKDSIFGDFADKRQYSEAQKDTTRILIVKATCIFGGGEIKSFL